MPRPKLVVFDLDLTLWECGDAIWCDCLSPPFRRVHESILDQRGNHIRIFDDAPIILDRLDDLQIPIGIASRTHQPTWAQELLALLEITDRFLYQEIYPESKLSHFSSLKEESRIAFEHMLFFDDEWRNIHEVSQLGVTAVHVPNGIELAIFDSAFQQFGSK